MEHKVFIMARPRQVKLLSIPIILYNSLTMMLTV